MDQTDIQPATVPDRTDTSDTPKRKRGAQPGNVNAVRHGMRSERHGLALGVLGKKHRGIYQSAVRFRRAIETALVRAGRQLSLIDHARIQSIVRLEIGARLMEHATRDGDVPPAEVRSHRAMILQNTLQRDRLLADLLGQSSPASGGGSLDWGAVGTGSNTTQTSEDSNG